MSLSAGDIVFYALASIVVISALVVTFSKNLIYSAFSLLGTLVGTAALYLCLNADFLGAAQVLVYVGGIAVLFLFAVMLTHQIDDSKTSNRHFGLPIAIPTGLLVIGICSFAVIRFPWPEAGGVNTNPTINRIGHALLNEYLLPFEFASVILLVVLIGAALVARREINLRIYRDRGDE